MLSDLSDNKESCRASTAWRQRIQKSQITKPDMHMPHASCDLSCAQACVGASQWGTQADVLV